MALFAFVSRQTRHRLSPQSLKVGLCAGLIAIGVGWSAHEGAGASSPVPERAFAHAYERGHLMVGVPYLAAEPKAGEKIRTPERLDTVMANKLAEQLGLPVRLIAIAPEDRTAALSSRRVDVLLVDHVISDTSSPSARRAKGIATGYVAQPKAIIRSDTTLRDWRDVKSLTVCMSSAAFQAQALASAHGATVRTYPVPSDALVAVREGNCDVGVVDDMLWTSLMAYPEWNNFSATLKRSGPYVERVWVTANEMATQDWLMKTMAQWKREGVLAEMTQQWARDIAFDVYLDQEVPDCHTGAV